MSELNPFVWDRPLADPLKVVGMDAFAEKIALRLKAQTNVTLFGPRGTGKSTFCNLLMSELAKVHGPDAPPFSSIYIDLQQAVSEAAFLVAVETALRKHPDSKLRRAAVAQLTNAEKTLQIDLKVFKAGVKLPPQAAASTNQALNAVLATIPRVASRIVVIFDEFQRLNTCPGEPLSAIRQNLMGLSANHVSLVFTGSIRQAIEMMTKNSKEPIFDQAAEEELPAINRTAFIEHVEVQFQATKRGIVPAEAVDTLVDLTQAHPKRTQQLAWQVWEMAKPDLPASFGDIHSAFNRIVSHAEKTYDELLMALANGSGEEVAEWKALQMLADLKGEDLRGRTTTVQYGFASRDAPTRAARRLYGKGLVHRVDGMWRIVDPLLAEILVRRSPFASEAPENTVPFE